MKQLQTTYLLQIPGNDTQDNGRDILGCSTLENLLDHKSHRGRNSIDFSFSFKNWKGSNIISSWVSSIFLLVLQMRKLQSISDYSILHEWESELEMKTRDHARFSNTLNLYPQRYKLDLQLWPVFALEMAMISPQTVINQCNKHINFLWDPGISFLGQCVF